MNSRYYTPLILLVVTGLLAASIVWAADIDPYLPDTEYVAPFSEFPGALKVYAMVFDYIDNRAPPNWKDIVLENLKTVREYWFNVTKGRHVMKFEVYPEVVHLNVSSSEEVIF